MTWALELFAAAFGAIIGSFLNVCIHRLPRTESIVWPGSACPACGRSLPWYENIPVASFLALRARCHGCRAPISWRYPLVEAITAVMFAGAWWLYGPSVLLVSRVIFGCALIVLFAVDLEHRILPDAITLPGIVVGFAFSFFTGVGWAPSLLGILFGGGVLWAMFELWLRLRGVEALGFGDVKMLAMVGAFLGWKLTFVTLLLGSFAGSILGLFLILFRRGGMQTALPFGTFLALGAAAAAICGQTVLGFYLAAW
jgi:leader peptidase (prepilin peptidase)/N-methyltransferase